MYINKKNYIITKQRPEVNFGPGACTQWNSLHKCLDVPVGTVGLIFKRCTTITLKGKMFLTLKLVTETTERPAITLVAEME